MSLSPTRALLLFAIALLPCMTLTSQPTAQVRRTPQFENDEVTVWKTMVPPNAPLTMHTHHHPRVIIALSGGTMTTVHEDGKSDSHPWETGKAYWMSTEDGKQPHADANKGAKPIEVMVVELKNAK